MSGPAIRLCNTNLMQWLLDLEDRSDNFMGFELHPPMLPGVCERIIVKYTIRRRLKLIRIQCTRVPLSYLILDFFRSSVAPIELIDTLVYSGPKKHFIAHFQASFKRARHGILAVKVKIDLSSTGACSTSFTGEQSCRQSSNRCYCSYNFQLHGCPPHY